jgi:hypothetical protein
MSDETDREIARLRDALRNRDHELTKAQELCASYRDTIFHLVERERDIAKQLAELRASLIAAAVAATVTRPQRCGASGQFGICSLPDGHEGPHAEWTAVQ